MNKSIAIPPKKKNFLIDPFYAKIFLIIIYTVGISGMALGYKSQLVGLTPVNLLFSVLILMAFHSRWNSNMILFVGINFALGLGVEIVGVRTGAIFGQYQYGESLGWKIWDTPILIGVNWLMLTYCFGMLVQDYAREKGLVIKSLFGAIGMVALDLLIEPVAIYLGFWDWGGAVPIQNYLAWFILAFILQIAFHGLIPESRNPLAFVLLILQVFFFLIIGLSQAW